MRRHPLPGLILLLSLSLACNLILRPTPAPTPTPTPAAGPGDPLASTAAPSPTPVPLPSPSPSPLPPTDLTPADTAFFDADWSRAIAGYQAALAYAGQSGDAALAAAARLGLGKTRLSAGDPPGAIAELSALLDSAPAEQIAFEAEFLRGEAYAALADWASAAGHYRRALALQPGLLDSYLQERLGGALAATGDLTGAGAAYRAALAAPRAGNTLALEEALAGVYAQAGDDAAALEAYERIAAASASDFVQARMDLLAGQALTRMGRTEEAFARYRHAVENYPRSRDSYNALVALVDAGAPVSELARGLTDYYAEQYLAAIAAFDRYLSAAPAEHAGAAHYYKALSLRALDQHGAAVNEFQTLIETHTGDPLWDDAWLESARTRWLWLDDLPGAIQTYLDFVQAAPNDPRAPQALDLAAGVADRAGDLARAARLWSRIPAEYPTAPGAGEGAFSAGIALYRAGDFGSATQLFQQAKALSSQAARQAAALLWAGKCAAAQGDLAGAQTAWQEAAGLASGYYSYRAQDLLLGRPPFTPPPRHDFHADYPAELHAAEDWLRAKLSLPPSPPFSEPGPILGPNARLRQAEALWRLGQYAAADAEFTALRQAFAGDPEASLRLTALLQRLGHYQAAILTARQALSAAGVSESAMLSAPAYFNHVRFGAYFLELVEPAAAANKLDPLFLLAVIRQESLFAGFATSAAQARGLMQIIPSTGEHIAAQLNWPGYSSDDLYRPVVSVQFGAYYLAEQLEMFDGDPYAALAAYNAGPGNAAAWKRLAPGDPDLFAEVVRYTETRNYIRYIYEVYAIYRGLYGE